MNTFVRILLILSVGVVGVFPIALQGPKYTRYDPCGLGVIQFDKTLVDNIWMGILNLGLYPNLKESTIEIHFKEPIKLGWTLSNSTLILGDDSKNFTIKHFGDIPKRFIFYVLLQNANSTPFVSEFIMNKNTMCSHYDKESHAPESIIIPSKDNRKYQYVCGRRSLDHTELMTTETDAKDGEWPWHVAVFIKDAVNPEKVIYECGGSIISRTAIVTSGHCVHNGTLYEPHRVVIVAGTTNLSDKSAPGLQRFVAKKVVLHPSYTEPLPTADLAVVIVDGLEFTEYVRPICLWGPSYPYEKSYLFNGYATMTGFGKTENNTLSNTLRTSNTMIQSDKTCILFAPKVYTRLLNEFSFCAGYGPKVGVNPRNGDSGGGLMLGVQQSDHKISWFLRGVFSKCGIPFGVKHCDPHFYVVYTDVAPHYTWLAHHAGLAY